MLRLITNDVFNSALTPGLTAGLLDLEEARRGSLVREKRESVGFMGLSPLKDWCIGLSWVCLWMVGENVGVVNNVEAMAWVCVFGVWRSGKEWIDAVIVEGMGK